MVVYIGTDGLGDKISPLQLGILCLVWKHEMEHVKQYTDTVVHSESFDERIVLEMCAAIGNSHFYQDNYGEFSFELQAYKAEFGNSFGMIKRALSDVGFLCSEKEIEDMIVVCAESIRDEGDVSFYNPFDSSDRFDSLGSIVGVLDSRNNAVRRKALFSSLNVFSEDATWFGDKGCVDLVGQYVKSGRSSGMFESLFFGDDTSGLDVLRCVAAVTYSMNPDVRYYVPGIVNCDFVCDSVLGYDVCKDVRSSMPVGFLSRFLDKFQNVGSSGLEHSYVERRIDMDSLHL